MADAKKCPFKVAGGIEDTKCSDDCAWFCNNEKCAVVEIAAFRGYLKDAIIDYCKEQ